MRSEKINKEMVGVSFHPKINYRSQSLVKSMELDPLEERLIEYGKFINEKLKLAQERSNLKEIYNCSFMPLINQKSKLMDKRKRLNSNLLRYEDLFEDSKKIHKEIKMEYKFEPDLSLTKNYKRCQSNNKNYKARNEITLIKMNNTYKPQIGRDPKIDRNSLGLPVGDYLYSQAKINREINKHDKEPHSIAIRKESKKLVENMKAKSYNMLFQLLDSNGDGIVSDSQVDFSCMLN